MVAAFGGIVVDHRSPYSSVARGGGVLFCHAHTWLPARMSSIFTPRPVYAGGIIERGEVNYAIVSGDGGEPAPPKRLCSFAERRRRQNKEIVL